MTTSAPPDDPHAALRHALIAEAREIARELDAPRRAPLLHDVVRIAAGDLDFATVAGDAAAIHDPIWRGAAFLALLNGARQAEVEQARQEIANTIASLANGAPTAAPFGTLYRFVDGLVSAGELELALRACIASPGAGAEEPVVTALVEAGRRDEAYDLVMRIPAGEHRDEMLAELTGEDAPYVEATPEDPAAVLEAARHLPPGAMRDRALEAALLAFVPDDESIELDPEPALAVAIDDEEREIVAALLAREYAGRADFAAARRWLAAVRARARRVAPCAALAYHVLEREADTVAAAELLAEVPPDERDDMTMRNLAIEQLRAGHRDAAAETLCSMTRGADWATWSLAGLAARYGQAELLRAWARELLPPSLRGYALLGAAAYLGDEPPYEGGYVFPRG